MDNNNLECRVVYIVKFLFLIVILFTVFILVDFTLIDYSKSVEIDDVYTIEHWTVIEHNGNTFETGKTYVSDRVYTESFTIKSKLPNKINDDSYLFFSIGKNVKVYINGELRKDFNEERDVTVPGGSVKRFYMLVPLTSADAGAEVRMERQATTRHAQVVPETYIGNIGTFYGFMMSKFALTFMLAEVLMLFSGVVILISIGMQIFYKWRVNMLYGALGIFIMSAWVITDSFLYPFVFMHYHVDGVVNYMLCLLIPVAPAIYLNYVQHCRYQKYMAFLMMISIINCIVWPILHFTNVIKFYDSLSYIFIVHGILVISAFVILIIDVVRGYAKEYAYTAFGFVGFLLGGLIEILYLNMHATSYEELPMVIGLSIFLIFVVIQQAVDIRKAFIDKQHAIDISEAKTKFLASMSHEIRTPINAILGMNQMILRENHNEVIEDYARTIKSSGNMLLMLVNDVLDFSKIEAGKLEINEAEFKMAEVLYDVMTLVKERAAEKDLEVQCDLLTEVPDQMISDEFRIRQILINLLNNAIKYTEAGSVLLQIDGHYTEGDKYELELIVNDTGRGIKKEDQKNLFQAFSRVDMKKNISVEGTGLGLAIVKSVVDSMHGSIGLESEYGKGSTFTVTLPVVVTDRTPLEPDFMERKIEEKVIEEECDYRAPEANVLAVDDNQSNLTIVKLFLKRTGIIPDLCDSGTKAIEMCKTKKYDLILLDHMMPEPDGIETLELIRNDKQSLNHDTKAVVLTANAIAGSRQKYLDAGFDDYLTKPIDFKVLENTVKRYIPEDKIQNISDRIITSTENDDGKEDSFVMEFMPDQFGTQTESRSEIRQRLTAIEGLDYDTALLHLGSDEAILEEIIEDMANESVERAERMRESVQKKDLRAYEIDAHAIKGLMATLGYMKLSDLARTHEKQAREKNLEFVQSESENLICKYEEFCKLASGR